ncbi:hypothetical protein [Oceanobacillus locisalsi]|uniref:Transglycosylase SLT domain-containing protein n=1 Tax=Oceanobacillus locisalsi TaxID=546107 RepID=A0ABW3NK28_9BACI
MPKGTEVIPAKKTRELLSNVPAYAKGIFGSAWDGVKSGASYAWDKTKQGAGYVKDGAVTAGKKVAEWTGNVWDYVKEPGKLLNIALEKVGASIPDGVGTMAEMAKGAFTTVKDKAVDFVKEKLKMGSPDAPNASAGATGWRPNIMQAAAKMGESVSSAEVQGIIAQIQRESNGNEKIIQSSAVWDVNMANNNPARGLLQYIPQTFSAYKVPGHGNILNGNHQLMAFFNNRNWRSDLPYGKSGWGPSGGRKYKRGTNYVPEDGPAYLHKGEAVIPAEYNQSSKGKDIIGLIGKRLGLSEDTLLNYHEGVVGEFSLVQELLRIQIQEIINQNPFLQRMVDGVRRTKETLSNQIAEAKQGIQTGMNRNKNELSQQEQANADKSLKRINKAEESISSDVDKESNRLAQNIGKKAGEIISDVTKSVNTMGTRIEKATGQAINKLETKIESVEKKADKAQSSANKAQKSSKSKSKSSGIKGRVNSLIQQGGSAAKKYFGAIEEDGDWMNDWSTHIGSKKQQKPYLLAGYDYAKSLGFREGKSAQKHLNRIKGYADGGIVDMKQLAWIAEGGWAESIISHDPAKRISQKAIWERTGDMLGFSDAKGNSEVLSKLERIAKSVENSPESQLLQKLIKVTKEGKVISVNGNELAEVMYGPFKEKEALDGLGRYFD